MAKTLLLVGGHGAGDPGASGNGMTEANETRRVNQALYNKLKSKIPVEIYNTSKDLYRSVDHSAYRNYEIIETHFNAFNGSANGTEVLIKSGFSPDGIDNGLLSAMSKYFNKRGIKQRDDLANMNKFASMGTSYRLIEVCFIDNGSDANIYNSKFDALITDMANAILKVYGASTSPDPQKPVQVPGTPKNDTGLWYQAHVKNLGWLDAVHDGQTSGTTGNALQIEAIRIDTRSLQKKYPDIVVNAKVHLSGIGWKEYNNVQHNTVIGTTGQNRAIEAIAIEVLGINRKLSVQAHLSGIGWTGAVPGGFSTGSTGLKKRIEAIRMYFL